MPLSKYRKMLEGLAHHPIKEAKLMGMGEPMLHPQFDEVCRIFKEFFPDAFLIVATNCQYPVRPGTKMGTKFENSMKYIDLLYFSIDGYKESYERDRAPAKWSKLETFLADFKNMDRHGCRVTCNYVVNPDNIQDIKIIQEKIVNEYKLEELRLNIAQDWSEEKSISNSKTISGYTHDQINYLKTNYSQNIKGKAPWTWSDCFWVNTGIYMTVEGNLKVCALNTDTESLGNIFDKPLDQILNSKKMNEIRIGCNTDIPSKHCENCSYKELSPILEKLIAK